jgi:hypothetical protein
VTVVNKKASQIQNGDLFPPPPRASPPYQAGPIMRRLGRDSPVKTASFAATPHETGHTLRSRFALLSTPSPDSNDADTSSCVATPSRADLVAADPGSRQLSRCTESEGDPAKMAPNSGVRSQNFRAASRGTERWHRER